jgi:hypothetical protein
LSQVKNDFKVKPEEITVKICEELGINYPKDEMVVTIHPEDRIININFKKLGKSLKLVGVYHHDFDTILNAREIMSKKPYDFYFLEMAPVTHHDLPNDKAQEEKIINKFLDKDFMKEIGAQTHRSPYLNYFDRYDRLPLFDSTSFEWFVKNILKNERYLIKESEQLVIFDNIL